MAPQTKPTKKKKRLRLKSSFKRFLIYLTFFILVFIYTINEIKKIKEEFAYRETIEYKLTENGYSVEDAKKLLEVFPEEKINYFIENKYNPIYIDIINQKYFLLKNFDQYVSYKEKHEDDKYEDVIAIVNIHKNDGWYNTIAATDINKNYEMIVNKYYFLEQDYERIDLQNIPLQYAYSGQRAAKIVIENFEQMRNDVEDSLKVRLMVNSSYRSFDNQSNLYESYKAISLQYADSLAARPGHSDHQTGLSIDIASLEHPSQDSFMESDEYKWLKDNCYKYGFIHRYPEGKENITGYNNDYWHFRYVGKDLAQKIYDEKITFDEYYAYYIET